MGQAEDETEKREDAEEEAENLFEETSNQMSNTCVICVEYALFNPAYGMHFLSIYMERKDHLCCSRIINKLMRNVRVFAILMRE